MVACFMGLFELDLKRIKDLEFLETIEDVIY